MAAHTGGRAHGPWRHAEPANGPASPGSATVR